MENEKFTKLVLKKIGTGLEFAKIASPLIPNPCTKIAATILIGAGSYVVKEQTGKIEQEKLTKLGTKFDDGLKRVTETLVSHEIEMAQLDTKYESIFEYVSRLDSRVNNLDVNDEILLDFIAEIEVKVEDKLRNILESSYFSSAVTEIKLVGLRAFQDEKMKMLENAIYQSCLNENISEEKKIKLIQLIDKHSLLAIKLLKIFSKTRVDAVDSEGYSIKFECEGIIQRKGTAFFNHEILLLNFPEITELPEFKEDKSYVLQLINELQDDNLIYTFNQNEGGVGLKGDSRDREADGYLIFKIVDNHPENMKKDVRYVNNLPKEENIKSQPVHQIVTPFGKDFLSFISPENKSLKIDFERKRKVINTQLSH